MNNKIIIILIISIIAVLGTSIILFLHKGRCSTKKLYHYFPLLAVILTISVVLFSNKYYSRKFQQEIKKYQAIKSDSSLILSLPFLDSIQVSVQEKKRLLDSLQNIEKELSKVIENIQKQEKIIGNQSSIKNEIKGTIQETQAEIERVRQFNEIIPNLDIPQKKGYTTSGDTDEFIFIPPNNPFDAYLEFGIQFRNEERINQIASIYIIITEIKDNKRYYIFGQYYKAQYGINEFHIKNYLLNKDAILDVGFFLKEDFSTNEYPRYYKITWTLPSLKQDSIN